MRGRPTSCPIEQDSPEFVWNGTYRKVLGSTSFFEAKFTGYWGYFDLDPAVQDGSLAHRRRRLVLGRRRVPRQVRSTPQSAQRVLLAICRSARARTTSSSASRSSAARRATDRSTSTTSTSTTSAAYPTYAYSYGYDLEGDQQAQHVLRAGSMDRWPRLTANLGLRIDSHSGEGANGIEYYSTTAVGPRLGVAFDLTGRGTSVLRAFYGQMYGGAVFDVVEPGGSWRVRFRHLRRIARRPTGGDRSESRRRTSTPWHPDIDHQRVDEFNVSLRAAALRTVEGHRDLHPPRERRTSSNRC